MARLTDQILGRGVDPKDRTPAQNEARRLYSILCRGMRRPLEIYDDDDPSLLNDPHQQVDCRECGGTRFVRVDERGQSTVRPCGACPEGAAIVPDPKMRTKRGKRKEEPRTSDPQRLGHMREPGEDEDDPLPF